MTGQGTPRKEQDLRTLAYSNLSSLRDLSERPLSADTKRDIPQAYDRFKLWIANVGALQSGSESLDERLAQLEHVFNTVRKLLVCLRDTLVDLADQRADPSIVNDPHQTLEDIEIVLDTLTNLMKMTRLVPQDSSTEEPLTMLVDATARERQQTSQDALPEKPAVRSTVPKRRGTTEASTPQTSQQLLYEIPDK